MQLKQCSNKKHNHKMLSAIAAVRRLNGLNRCSSWFEISPCSKLIYTHCLNQEKLSIATRNIHTLRKWQPATPTGQSHRHVFTDETIITEFTRRDRKLTQELMERVPLLIPKYWPRLPVLVNQGEPLFPNCLKIFEVGNRC